MPDEYEPYPKICECCPNEFDGDDDAAKAAGWRLGWDGWLCGKCNEPAPNFEGKGLAATNATEWDN